MRKEQKFLDVELEALLNGDSYHTQEIYAEYLGVPQETISLHFKGMGMVQNQGDWVSFELMLEYVERRFFTGVL
ncbi:hypothetical protein TNCV_551181 [Trichonephila clavipes]|nr:hypothetical protein TNCV_551181 [Trichonephila clavipes]